MSLKTRLVIDIPLTTGGISSIDNGEVTLPLTDIGGEFAEYCTDYRITGTQTLGSNFSITMTGTPAVNTVLRFYWEAVCTHAGFVVSILGKTIDNSYVGKPFYIELAYHGVAWSVEFFSPSLYAAGSVNADRLQDATIATAKLIDLSVTTAKINDLGVTTGKLADLGVTTGKLADTAVTTAKITDLNVTTGKIADLAVTTAKLAATSVTTAKIAAGAVTANELGAAAVTTAKIDAGAVTANELGAAAVTTAKIDAGAVTTNELGAAAVTPTKMSTVANTYTRDFVLSFQLAAEVGVLNYTINETCSIVGITTTVLAPPATDDITLIFKNNGGTELTDSQTDITTAHVLGNQVAVTPSANNTFAVGDTFTIEGSKTTKTSGKVNVAIRILKA